MTRHAPLALLLALLGAACAAGDAGAGADDTGAAEVLDDAVADTGIPVDAAVEGELVLGTNPAGYAEPAQFRALADGGELSVERGFQDLWMVVLAFRTRDVFPADARLALSGELTVGGVSQGALALVEQRLTDGGDGWAYYYDFFLVVNDPSIGGEAGQVDFSVQDAAGHARRLHLAVQLTGGE